jgi:hypothetical protein
MKTFRFSLPLLAIVLAIGASAFTVEPSTTKSTDTLYHWFSPDLSTYLGQRSIADQEVMCPGTGNVCARGFDQIDTQQRPVGTQKATTTEQ